MVPKFNCQKCGQCCRHIRGILPKSDYEFLKEVAYGKLPIAQLVPIERMTFPLYDWEAKEFRERNDGAAEIKPLRAIYDLDSNKTIIVSYFIDADSCPFLKNNTCAIYDKKRAYICRMFPFQKNPLADKKADIEEIFGNCPSVAEIKDNIPKENREEYFRGCFPDGSFNNAVEHDKATKWVNKKIIELMKTKKIRPAMGYPYEFLLRRINNSEKIDFSDFLGENGIIILEEIEKLIKE